MLTEFGQQGCVEEWLLYGILTFFRVSPVLGDAAKKIKRGAKSEGSAREHVLEKKSSYFQWLMWQWRMWRLDSKNPLASWSICDFNQPMLSEMFQS